MVTTEEDIYLSCDARRLQVGQFLTTGWESSKHSHVLASLVIRTGYRRGKPGFRQWRGFILSQQEPIRDLDDAIRALTYALDLAGS